MLSLDLRHRSCLLDLATNSSQPRVFRRYFLFLSKSNLACTFLFFPLLLATRLSVCLRHRIMKLRIRAASGGPTLKLEVASQCSLQTLREALREALASNGNLSDSPIRLSLNKKDEIQGPGAALLTQFGVRSGDLLFYLDSLGVDPINSTGSVAGGSTGMARDCDVQIPTKTSLSVSEARAWTAEARETVPEVSTGAVGSPKQDAVSIRRELCAAAATRRASLTVQSSAECAKALPSSLMEDSGSSPTNTPRDGSLPSPQLEVNERNSCDDMDFLTGSGSEAMESEASPNEASNSIPVLLQRVLLAEYGNASGPDALLILAVHAVMLETGFVAIDLQRSAIVEGSGLPSGWIFRGTVNLHYTLPEIGQGVEELNIGTISLRCQTVGNTVVIYGTITGGSGSPIYRLCLQTSKFLTGKEERMYEGQSSSSVDPSPNAGLLGSFSDLFGLWKLVKDGLSLPLLTALCERAGLPVPLSLLRIPIELKMKILEYLPALDLLRVGCTCSELRHLTANDELWKQNFMKEFGFAEGQRAPGGGGWKDAFRQRFIEEKRRLERRARPRIYRFGIPPGFAFPPSRGFPPMGGIIGGDYDIFPAVGGLYRGGLGGTRGPFGGLHGGVGGGSGCEYGGLRGGVGGRTGTPDEVLLPGRDPLNLEPRLGPGSWYPGDSFD